MGHGNARHGRQATPLAHNLSRAALGPVSVPSVARGSGLAVAIMINIPVGARVLLGTRPIDLAKVHSSRCLGAGGVGRGSVLWRGQCVSRQVQRPPKDIGLGYQRACRQAASQPRRTARRSPAADRGDAGAREHRVPVLPGERQPADGRACQGCGCRDVSRSYDRAFSVVHVSYIISANVSFGWIAAVQVR